MASLENRVEVLLRKAVWFWAEHPWKFYSAVAIATCCVGASIVARRRRNRETDEGLLVTLTGRSRQAVSIAIASRTAASLSVGYLKPLATASKVVLEDGSIPFVVSVIDSGAAKAKAQALSHPAAAPARLDESRDAFRVLDRASIVGSIGSIGKYAVVLNKFPSIHGHCVIVAQGEMVPQRGPMNQADIGALWEFVVGTNGLGFYNSGDLSGASQPRRHMQAIPGSALWESYPPEARARLAPWAQVAPSSSTGAGSVSSACDAAVPIDVAIAQAREAAGYAQAPGAAFTLPAFAFPHAACVLGLDLLALAPHSQAAAARLHEWYSRLLQVASRVARAQLASVPSQGSEGLSGDALSASVISHNVVLTRRWMLVVPRTQPEWDGVSVNALGYAGLLLVKGQGQLEAMRVGGPMQVLRACATNGQVADA